MRSIFWDRVKTWVWGLFYTILTSAAVFLVQNVDVIGGVINELFADKPKTASFIFTIVTIGVMQIGRWLRDKNLMPFFEPTK